MGVIVCEGCIDNIEIKTPQDKAVIEAAFKLAKVLNTEGALEFWIRAVSHDLRDVCKNHPDWEGE